MPETVLMLAPPTEVPFVLGLELFPWLGLLSGRSLKLYNKNTLCIYGLLSTFMIVLHFIAFI